MLDCLVSDQPLLGILGRHKRASERMSSHVQSKQTSDEWKRKYCITKDSKATGGKTDHQPRAERGGVRNAVVMEASPA